MVITREEEALGRLKYLIIAQMPIPLVATEKITTM